MNTNVCSVSIMNMQDSFKVRTKFFSGFFSHTLSIFSKGVSELLLSWLADNNASSVAVLAEILFVLQWTILLSVRIHLVLGHEGNWCRGFWVAVGYLE